MCLLLFNLFPGNLKAKKINAIQNTLNKKIKRGDFLSSTNTSVILTVMYPYLISEKHRPHLPQIHIFFQNLLENSSAIMNPTLMKL